MTERRKEHEGVMTKEEKAEAKARLKEAWDEIENNPSEAAGFEGATPC